MKGVENIVNLFLVNAGRETRLREIEAVLRGRNEQALRKCWSSRPACLHRGHDRWRLPDGRGCGVGLYVARGVNCLVSFEAVALSTLESVAVRISSSSESKAWEISGLRDARVLDLNSVPYLCLTRWGNSLWTSFSQVSTTIFSRVGVISSSDTICSPWCVMSSVKDTRV